jgi:hypothetical protein
MKMTVPAAAAAVILSSLMATYAEARPITLREALAMGFEVKSTTFIAATDINRVMGSTEWKDDVLLTLQRGSQLAFCHMLASSTANIEGDADVIECSYTVDIPIEDPPPAEPAQSEQPPAATAQ